MKGDQPADRWCGHVWPPWTVEGWTQVREMRVRITELRDDIFYAELILDQNTRVSARVSDAIALALHLGVPSTPTTPCSTQPPSPTPRSAPRATIHGRRGRGVPPVPRHRLPRRLRPGLMLIS